MRDTAGSPTARPSKTVAATSSWTKSGTDVGSKTKTARSCRSVVSDVARGWIDHAQKAANGFTELGGRARGWAAGRESVALVGPAQPFVRRTTIATAANRELLAVDLDGQQDRSRSALKAVVHGRD